MKDQTNRQKGAQEHAEGEHGVRTKEAIRANLTSDTGPEDGSESTLDGPTPGRHRIYEDREQHDEADKNSEKNRLARDADAGRTVDTPAAPTPRDRTSE